MNKIDKKVWFSLLAVVVLAVVSCAFFYPDAVMGRQLQQSDMLQGLANGHEGKAFEQATGETTRWTNALFGGMPNFQISPSYPSSTMLDWVAKVYTLGLPSPSNLLFAMFLGFFLMCLCLRTRWYTALLGALAWGFSTYFIIIIGAGHIWKFLTLMYIPPTIGGIMLCYRGKYLGGTAMASLFAALQLQSNHPQMSYYFVLVISMLVIGWLVLAIKERTLKQWGMATLCTVLAGMLGVAANAPSLYNSYEYSKETIRGHATEIADPSAAGQSKGADFDYITAWSYGIDETATLLIPNVKGGASIQPVAGRNTLKSVADTPGVENLISTGRLSYEEADWLRNYSGLPQYFGDQPMTNGPVYVGIIILMLAMLAMVVADNRLKWALLAATLLSILLAWGYHVAPISHWFVDHFPMYNKFRTVSSILVIAEFTIPLLAVLCIQKMVQDREQFWQQHKVAFLVCTGLLALMCLAGMIFPEIYGNPITAEEHEIFEKNGLYQAPEFTNILHAIREGRLSLVRADSLRSLIFLALGAGSIFLFLGPLKKMKYGSAAMVGCLVVLTLVDLYSVNKRYVNSDNFVDQAPEASFEPTAIDNQILQDTAMNYRVMDYTDFGGARNSYFHKSVGGYHAAKLTRYNDLITHHINKGKHQAIDMLNAKYVITTDSAGQKVALPNPNALGNAWFVSDIEYVDNAPTEMTVLGTINPAVKAVADKKFEQTLGKATPVAPGDTIFETTYAPNQLTYHAKSAKGGLAVFSEVYFPWGWKATVDGQEVPIGRVNYVLRAIKVPAGEHTIVMTFDPESMHVTNGMSIASIILIYLLCLGALVLATKPLWHRQGKQQSQNKN